MAMAEPAVVFDTRKAVDFVVIGSGASGGILAKELATAGFDVVVLEQGPYRRAGDFTHDELQVMFLGELTDHPSWSDPQTFRESVAETARVRPPQTGPPPALYARGVGGSSVHFTANYWRLRPLDFSERSLLGEISGTGFADWPITYEELEPYYSRVDWEIGVSGAPGPGLARTACAAGDPVTSAQWPGALHALRLLHGFRLRGGRQVIDAGRHDSAGRGQRSL